MKNINFNITVIRHAPTIYSEQNLFMGTLDIPCSEEGKNAAIEARNKVSAIKYFRIYCSPLSRATQTTQCLFPEKNFIINSSLIERGLGSWTGKNLTKLKKDYPEAFSSMGKINPYYTPPNGETIENVIYRVKIFLDLLINLFEALQSDNKSEAYNIAIVTHNGIIRVMRYLIENSSISEIFIESEPHLTPMNYYFDGKHWKNSHQ